MAPSGLALEGKMYAFCNDLGPKPGRSVTRLMYSFTRGPNMPNIRHIRAYCRMGAYIRECC
eukprot:COSAG01_NODE_29742_length_630_cov_2.387947_2_plen_60_part_01